MDVDSGEEENGSEDDLLEVLDISDDDTAAVGEGHDDADVQEVGWGVEPGRRFVQRRDWQRGWRTTCC